VPFITVSFTWQGLPHPVVAGRRLAMRLWRNHTVQAWLASHPDHRHRERYRYLGNYCTVEQASREAGDTSAAALDFEAASWAYPVNTSLTFVPVALSS
jgi:hypothetical protein